MKRHLNGDNMKSITKKAYGKINLILKVGDKRADGRHEVLTVMQKVGVYDTVTVSETEKKGIFIECSLKELASAENLAYKAAERYFEAAGRIYRYLTKEKPGSS